MAESTQEISDQLTAISGRLGDCILESLQAAVLAGAEKRPADERVLTRARNAVDKAIHLLEGLGDSKTAWP